MFARSKQDAKSRKVIYLTLTLLITTPLQSQAREMEGLDDTKIIIGVQKPSLGVTARNTTLCVIDSYFDPYSDTHQSLTKSTMDAFGGEDPKLVTYRAHAYHLGGDHANHVSSIIHNIAPHAKLRVIDIYDEPGVKDAGGHNARLVAAIDAAIKSKVDFINISQRISPDDERNGKISKELKKALYKARDAGIGIIKSAGNDNERIGSTPYTRSLAKLLYKMQGSMVIVAAASYEADNQENLAKFSNKAGIAYKYTVTAPGTDILAYGADNKLVKMSGTSMAAPVITATAGLLKEVYPDLSAKEIFKSIRHSSRKVGSISLVDLPVGKYGQGIVDFHRAIIEAEKLHNLKAATNCK